MYEPLTIVDTPSTTGGSVLSLRDRIQDLMTPTTGNQPDAERQSPNWRLDDDCDPDYPSMAHLGMQFEER